jgi:hypothetical protein
MKPDPYWNATTSFAQERPGRWSQTGRLEQATEVSPAKEASEANRLKICFVIYYRLKNKPTVAGGLLLLSALFSMVRMRGLEPPLPCEN